MTKVRTYFSEFLGTALLLLVIVGSGTMGERLSGAYWFTSSTSFANPAVTLARMATDTFSGIAPHSAPRFIGAQFLGLILFSLAWKVLKERETTA